MSVAGGVTPSCRSIPTIWPRCSVAWLTTCMTICHAGRPALPTKRDLKGTWRATSSSLAASDQASHLACKSRPFFDDELKRGERIVGWHGIAGVGDPRIPNGVCEIDVGQGFRDAFVRDAHRLGQVLGRQGERGRQHFARGPAGISNVRASFTGCHACFLFISHTGVARHYGIPVKIMSGSERGTPRGWNPHHGTPGPTDALREAAILIEFMEARH